MKIKSVLILVFTIISNHIFAQNEYNVKAKIKGFEPNKKIYLAHYLGSSQYVKIDSSIAKSNEVEFKGTDDAKGGIYLIVLSPSKFYDFILSGNEKNIEITADTSDFLSTVKFKGSKENDILYEYRRFLKAKNDAVSALKPNPKSVADMDKYKNIIKTMQTEVGNKMKDIVNNNSNLFVSKVIKANMDVNLPNTLPKLANGKNDSTYLFNFYKNHYFDNIDFKDERMLYTPFIQTKVDNYFKDLVYQIPDSIIVDCDRILSKVKTNQNVYRYVLWLLTSKYENSNTIGMETVYVYLAENYYLKDAVWLDSSATAKIAKRVKVLKPLLPGKVMPTLNLPDVNGTMHNLDEIKANYTIVYFYSHECGHCKEHAHELVKYYDENKAKGIEVVAVDVYPSTKLEDVTGFIKSYKTDKMLNLWDKFHQYNFYDDYDAYSTPTTYILDKDKHILGKRLQISEFNKFIEFQEKRNATLQRLKK